jgi:PHD/YefM family antitoxin component YafN of YafNO toxin-antitoxin module
MNIKPSAAIRKNYNEISTLCRETGEPVYLTKNGVGDLVVMDIAAFTRRESMLHLRETLVAVEEDRLAGKKGFFIDDVDEMVKKTIMQVADGQHK